MILRWSSEMLCIVLLAALAIVPSQSAQAQANGRKALALVVGVQHFTDGNIKALETPVGDAQAIARKLKDTHRFEEQLLVSTTGGQQASREAILEAWDGLVGRLKSGDTILLYFAGHGFELKGRNYLLPSNARKTGGTANSAGELTRSAVDLQYMIERLSERQDEVGDITGIFVIDACRENPYGNQEELADASPVGLIGPSVASRELFIMYSAGIGQKALDVGDTLKHHSLFAEKMLELIAKPELPIAELALRLKLAVYTKAYQRPRRHIQIPAYYDQLKAPRLLSGGRAEPQKFVAGAEPLRLDWSQMDKGDVIIECTHCPELIVVDPAANGTGANNTKKFALGKYEVTNREWDACTQDKDKAVACPGAIRAPLDKPHFVRLPVTGVSWRDAQAFVAWLNKVTDTGQKPYRLPTEVEWEFAARAGTTKDYSFDMTDKKAICEHANGADHSIGLLPRSYQHCSDGVGRSVAQVGRYRPNTFGFHDMHGNTWEWTQDCWQAGVTQAGVSEAGCDRRVVRGGSWRSDLAALRTSSRNGFPPGHGRSTVGFRVARDVQ